MENCREFKIDEDGWLVASEGVTLTTTPNKGGLRNSTHHFIVMHYTAGPSMQGAIRSFKDSARKASAHFIIDKDGSVAQLVSTDNIAWHAGKSSLQLDQGLIGVPYIRGLNDYSIGIEFVNAGKLIKTGDVYRTWWGSKVDKDSVYIAELFQPGKYAGKPTFEKNVPFEVFTPEQIESGLAICHELVRKYPIIDVVGHSDIAIPEGRKLDPGPAFPMASFRALLRGRTNDDDC